LGESPGEAIREALEAVKRRLEYRLDAATLKEWSAANFRAELERIKWIIDDALAHHGGPAYATLSRIDARRRVRELEKDLAAERRWTTKRVLEQKGVIGRQRRMLEMTFPSEFRKREPYGPRKP
jgi:hypothetical protein